MTTDQRRKPLFKLGNVVHTAGVVQWIAEGGKAAGNRAHWLGRMLGRHESGNWGDLDKQDWAENQRALSSGLRIFSTYRAGPDTPELDDHSLWIVTEAGRHSTTVLWPKEY